MADSDSPQLTHGCTPALAEAPAAPAPGSAATVATSRADSAHRVSRPLAADRFIMGWLAAWWLGHSGLVGHCGSAVAAGGTTGCGGTTGAG